MPSARDGDPTIGAERRLQVGDRVAAPESVSREGGIRDGVVDVSFDEPARSGRCHLVLPDDAAHVSHVVATQRVDLAREG